MKALPVELDTLDRALVELLQEDARLSNREIAERVGSTEPTVRRRIDRLVRMGAVRIAAVVSPFALGYDVVAIIGLQIDRRKQASIEAMLGQLLEVRFLVLTVGSYDMMIEVWFRDNHDLLDFLATRLTSVHGILRAESWQVLKLAKYSYT
jgi:Lrp/AsnC family transcriptional regulator for asnA, asnC and gidA